MPEVPDVCFGLVEKFAQATDEDFMDLVDDTVYHILTDTSDAANRELQVCV